MTTVLKTKGTKILSGIVGTAIGAALCNPVAQIMDHMVKYPFKTIPTAWVISPSGKLIAEFPFNTAFRIYRKRRKQGWNISTIKPYVPYWKRLFKIVRVIPFKQDISLTGLNSILSLAPMLIYMGFLARGLRVK